jgi:hypothetical protein
MSASFTGKSTGLKRAWQHHLRHVPATIAVFPVVFALLSGGLLAWVGQMHEIYLGMIERDEWFRFLIGYMLLISLSSALHGFYLAETQDSVPRVLGNTTKVGPNPHLAKIRHVIAALCGLAPQLGLFWGVWEVQDILQFTADSYYEATAATGSRGALKIPFHDQDPVEYKAVHEIIRNGYLYLLWCIAGMVVYGFVSLKIHNRGSDGDRSAAGNRIVFWTTLLLTVASYLILPAAGVDTLLFVTQAVGPLAMTATQLTTVFALLAFASILSRRMKLPVLWILIGYMLVRAYSDPTKIESVAEREPPGRSAAKPAETVQAEASRTLETAFVEWAQTRREEIKNFGKPYPVFVVAAQGGGIYAASAAAMFLGTLQEQNPSFVRHLFAVSGVSGGAVGSAIFHAAVRADVHKRDWPSTDAALPPVPALTKTIRATLTQDHLSPVLGLLVADYAEKLVPWISMRRWLTWLGFKSSLDRATALEASLACAFDRQRRASDPDLQNRSAKSTCEWATLSGGLRTPFSQLSHVGDAPSLILNTTFAETGKRVAFANFSLKAAGEGALQSFHDADFRQRGGAMQLAPDTSLGTAAVASARFPGLMPAFVVYAVPANDPKGNPNDKKTKRWNFVDGGYADNSGVASAAAVMAALQSTALVHGIDLKLLILAEDNRERDPIEYDGTSLVDSRAPIEALLQVRASIASREVHSAVTRFKPTSTSDWKVKTFRLDQKKFSLRLGWNISNATNFFLSLFTTPPDKITPDLIAACRQIDEDEKARAAGKPPTRKSSSGAKVLNAVATTEAGQPNIEDRQIAEDALIITENRCNMIAVRNLLLGK